MKVYNNFIKFNKFQIRAVILDNSTGREIVVWQLFPHVNDYLININMYNKKRIRVNNRKHISIFKKTTELSIPEVMNRQIN